MAEENGPGVPSADRGTQLSESASRKGLLTSVEESRDEEQPTTPEPIPRESGGAAGGFSPLPGTPPRTPASPATESAPKTTNMSKFLAPSRTFARLNDEKEELSKATPSPHPTLYHDGFTMPLIGEVKPEAYIAFAKVWLRNPKNIVLLIWGLAVVVSGAILFMVMVGMLDGVLKTRDARNAWFEVSNQIINALFVLMVLYLHPQRCLHVYLLWRWNRADIVQMRKVYCKNGQRKPHEWGHMLVIVMLLQLNCFGQYALCGLNWGYKRSERPAIGVAICLVFALGGGCAAGIYNVVSPLGKDFAVVAEDPDVETGSLVTKQSPHFAPHTRIYKLLERKVTFAYKDEGSLVEKAEWKGGIFDVKDEPMVCLATTLCCPCVFGWNMERLGFGNRFVHIITFVLICTSPFWIFDLAALNIENHKVRDAVGIIGIVLCGFGLFYGGYWRIRIRDRFNLPGYKLCCCKANVTDCLLWLFCPFCSLCQEVRTAEFYDVKDDRFYSRARRTALESPSEELAASPLLSPAPEALSAVRETSRELSFDSSRATSVTPSRETSMKEGALPDGMSRGSGQSEMTPPSPVTADRNLDPNMNGSVRPPAGPSEGSSEAPDSSTPAVQSGSLDNIVEEAPRGSPLHSTDELHSGSPLHSTNEIHSGSPLHPTNELHSGSPLHSTNELHSGSPLHPTNELHSGSPVHSTNEFHSGSGSTPPRSVTPPEPSSPAVRTSSGNTNPEDIGDPEKR